MRPRSFRQLVENIREIFWMQEGGWERLLYMSPAYERRLGPRAPARASTNSRGPGSRASLRRIGTECSLIWSSRRPRDLHRDGIPGGGGRDGSVRWMCCPRLSPRASGRGCLPDRRARGGHHRPEAGRGGAARERAPLAEPDRSAATARLDAPRTAPATISAPSGGDSPASPRLSCWGGDGWSWCIPTTASARSPHGSPPLRARAAMTSNIACDGRTACTAVPVPGRPHPRRCVGSPSG